MLIRSRQLAGPLLFPKLGDAGAPAPADTSVTADKAGDLATVLSLLSSLVFLLRK